MASEMVDREEAGLRPPTRKTKLPVYPATHLIVHHGASPTPSSFAAEKRAWRTYQAHHMDTRGWSDIAYSFGFGPASGNRYLGRGWLRQSGATGSPHDRFSISFCAIGNFDKDRPPRGMLRAMVIQAVNGIKKGHLVGPGQLVWMGHKDKPYGTACPGRYLYAEIPSLIRATKAVLEDLDQNPPPPPPDEPEAPVIPLTLETLDARVRLLESKIL